MEPTPLPPEHSSPDPLITGPNDLCTMPYTSGTTGLPKGCMHTHRSVMSTLVGGARWFGTSQDTVCLAVLPFFHVTGLAGSLNGPLYVPAPRMVVLARWDREVAAICMQRYRVTVWQAISTMVIDFLAHPLDRTASIFRQPRRAFAAAARPCPTRWPRASRRSPGLDYIEGYGMSETMAATHINPHPPAQGVSAWAFRCSMWTPAWSTPRRSLSWRTGETGEIVVHGPQVMQGYWRNPQATPRVLRRPSTASASCAPATSGTWTTDGYFFMTDRLKRMINASGFKVWPAEVEALMYHHPAIQEACVIGVRDARRGEIRQGAGGAAPRAARPGQRTGRDRLGAHPHGGIQEPPHR